MAITYAFLTVADVNSRIRDEHRHDLRDYDPPPPDEDEEDEEESPSAEGVSNAIELSCESMAIAKVRSALHHRYNTTALFDAEDEDRDPLLVLHVLNVFVYLLYRRINPRKIPEVVKEDHDETLAWLDRVAAGKEAPDFPPAEPADDNAGTARFGGGQRVRGHYF